MRVLLEIALVECRDRHGLFGAKGVGEIPIAEATGQPVEQLPWPPYRIIEKLLGGAHA